MIEDLNRKPELLRAQRDMASSLRKSSNSAHSRREKMRLTSSVLLGIAEMFEIEVPERARSILSNIGSISFPHPTPLSSGEVDEIKDFLSEYMQEVTKIERRRT